MKILIYLDLKKHNFSTISSDVLCSLTERLKN